MRLKFFCDKQYLSENAPLAPILYPFWEKSSQSPSHLWMSTVMLPALEPFLKTARSCFEMVPIQEADFVLLPNDLEFSYLEDVKSRSTQLIELAKSFSKPTVGFFSGDCSHLKLPFEVDITFRDSLYHSTRNFNEFATPTWIDDLIKGYSNNQFQVRNKQEKAVIGFCGYAAPSRDLKTLVKTLLYKVRRIAPKPKATIPPHNTGHVIRTLALSKLKASSLIETNFVLRGNAGLIGKDASEAKVYRNTYVKNLLNSDYVFCCRGSGNYSNRLYETLCCGRIPIFIDTDCVLPLEFDINWKDYCVYIKEDEISKIDKKVYEFHQQLSPEKFIELQHKCRKMWEEKLSPEGFFSNFYRHFDFLNKTLESEKQNSLKR